MKTDLTTMFVEYADTQASTSLGIAKDLFNDCKHFLVTKSKKEGNRSSMLFTKLDKNGNILLGPSGRPLTLVVSVSEKLTPRVQDGSLTAEHLLGFNVFQGTNGGLFFGFTNEGLVKDAVIKQWKPIAISLDDTTGL